MRRSLPGTNDGSDSEGQKRIIPVIALLEGEYGYDNLFMGVPAILGGDGIERIFELELTAEERAR